MDRVKVAIRMGPSERDLGPLRVAGLGWLKWREFGRRGDTARDQVIQVSSWNSMCVGWRLPVGTEDSKAGPLPTLVEGGRKSSRIRPLIRKDYPLSLSISLSGGEETNQDFPSNGERTGKSPA